MCRRSVGRSGGRILNEAYTILRLVKPIHEGQGVSKQTHRKTQSLKCVPDRRMTLVAIMYNSSNTRTDEPADSYIVHTCTELHAPMVSTAGHRMPDGTTEKANASK